MTVCDAAVDSNCCWTLTASRTSWLRPVNESFAMIDNMSSWGCHFPEFAFTIQWKVSALWVFDRFLLFANAPRFLLRRFGGESSTQSGIGIISMGCISVWLASSSSLHLWCSTPSPCFSPLPVSSYSEFKVLVLIPSSITLTRFLTKYLKSPVINVHNSHIIHWWHEETWVCFQSRYKTLLFMVGMIYNWQDCCLLKARHLFCCEHTGTRILFCHQAVTSANSWFSQHGFSVTCQWTFTQPMQRSIPRTNCRSDTGKSLFWQRILFPCTFERSNHISRSSLVIFLDAHLGSAHMSLSGGVWAVSMTVPRQHRSIVDAEITFVL